MMFRHGLRVSEAIGIRRRLKRGLDVEHPLNGNELRAIKRYSANRTNDLPWLFTSERGQPRSPRRFTSGRPVLVDLDSGFDATWSVGSDAGDAALDLLKGRRTLAEAAVETAEGFRLLAASPVLVRLESLPVGELAARLRVIAADEWLVVDTAPGFAPVLKRAAIRVADAIVVPFVPSRIRSGAPGICSTSPAPWASTRSSPR